LKRSISIQQPDIRAKIIGLILIAIGVALFFSNNTIYLKLSFALLLIGLLLIFMITEKTVPSKISKAQIEGNFNAFENITKSLNLAGSAVFIPKSNMLSEEKIFIPLEKKNNQIPELNDNIIFSTGADGKSLGMAVPPSGLKLLEEVEKETEYVNINSDNIEEQLQGFVGMNLINSIELKKSDDKLRLEITKPIFCQKNETMCRQYPCPTCSAILTAITRSKNKKIWISDVVHNGKKVEFSLKIGD